MRFRERDLAARVVEVHPVAPPLLRRLLLVRRAGSSRTMERGCAATKGLWWQVNLQLVHTGVDAFAVRRWGCSSWQACASTRVVLTGGAHGLAGCTLRASKKAARCTSCCPRDHRGTIWELQWRTMSVHHRLCACVGEGCAACSESQWQRAPTLSVASVVECPRLVTGLAVSIEASPELLGVSPKRPQNAGGRRGAPLVKGAGVEISKRRAWTPKH